MSKITLLAAGATGYVLGARAGRQRYEQIVTQAQRVWTHPRVQQVSHEAQDLAREKAPIVGAKIGEAAKQATGTVASAVSRDNDGDELDDLEVSDYPPPVVVAMPAQTVKPLPDPPLNS